MTSTTSFQPPRDEGPSNATWAPFLWSLFGAGVGHAFAGKYTIALFFAAMSVMNFVLMLICTLANLGPWTMVANVLIWCAGPVLYLISLGLALYVKPTRPSHLRAATFWIVSTVAVVGTILIARTQVARPYEISSSSMAPALRNGDHIMAWVGLSRPAIERGQVVVFRYPKDRSITYVKRVVGLPGDTIEVRDNHVIRNGVIVPFSAVGTVCYQDDLCHTKQVPAFAEDDYVILKDPQPSPLSYTNRMTVPSGKIYVLGDNRDRSGDSRQWGFVPLDDVVGVTSHVWASSNPCDPPHPRRSVISLSPDDPPRSEPCAAE